MLSYYNPSIHLYKIQVGGHTSYIQGTNHTPLNHKIPYNTLNAIKSSNYVLSELYGITYPLGHIYNPNNNSIIDILIINQAKNLNKQVIPLETDREHCGYAVVIGGKRDYNVLKYPVYYKNVIIDFRNRKWLNLIIPYIFNYNVFIAIGIDHVPGILESLTRYGCKINKI